MLIPFWACQKRDKEIESFQRRRTTTIIPLDRKNSQKSAICEIFLAARKGKKNSINSQPFRNSQLSAVCEIFLYTMTKTLTFEWTQYQRCCTTTGVPLACFFARTRARYYLTRCNTLQHIATHCNTLQHTAAHCNTLQHTATHSIGLFLRANSSKGDILKSQPYSHFIKSIGWQAAFREFLPGFVSS